MNHRRLALLAVSTCITLMQGQETVARVQSLIDSNAGTPEVGELTAKPPLYFEPIDGGFAARGRGYTARISGPSSWFAVGNAAIDLTLVGSSAETSGQGLDLLPGKSNYFLGNDPAKWRTNVPHYATVRYANVYPGIDLIYHEGEGRLEFDFVVRVGANPDSIHIAWSGAEASRLEPEGTLVLSSSNGELQIASPRIYQESDGRRREVAGGFRLERDEPHVASFHVATYDKSLPLVIDPQLVYSTYLGGNAGEDSDAIGLDAAGNIYVGGTTASTNFPVKNALQPTSGGGSFDAFLTKFSPDGSTLLYSTYLGGVGTFEEIYAIAVDSQGNAYIAGDTTSNNFPTVNPIQASYMGNTDGWIAKITPDGSSLLYSTFLGGSLADQVLDIAIDGAGNAYLVGHTASANFPTKDPLQASHLGGWDDAFVAKIDASGSTLVFSTYLGGDGSDEARGIAIDSDTDIYITGDTRSAGFPVTSNALQPVKSGDADIFVTKLAPTGQSILYSTFLGGSGTDESFGIKLIAVDAARNIYVTGNVFSDDFPTVNPIQAGPSGGADGFVSKIKADGSGFVYSTYLGSTAYDDCFGIVVDAWDNAHIVGESLGNNFPISNAFQSAFGGASDAVILELSPAGALIYSTYLGGSNNERANDIVLDSNGNPYVTGQVWSNNFPTVNPFQNRLRGPQDGFVAKITEAHPPLEVISLDWSNGDKSTLAWSATAGVDTYDLYRGDGADLPKLANAEVDSCLEIQTPNLDSGPLLAEEPPAGTFYWYLVRGENSIGLGLLGSASHGPRILDPSGTCP